MKIIKCEFSNDGTHIDVIDVTTGKSFASLKPDLNGIAIATVINKCNYTVDQMQKEINLLKTALENK